LGTVETGIYKRPWKSVVEAGDRIRFVGQGSGTIRLMVEWERKAAASIDQRLVGTSER
jgi:hypothetical protein